MCRSFRKDAIHGRINRGSRSGHMKHVRNSVIECYEFRVRKRNAMPCFFVFLFLLFRPVVFLRHRTVFESNDLLHVLCQERWHVVWSRHFDPIGIWDKKATACCLLHVKGKSKADGPKLPTIGAKVQARLSQATWRVGTTWYHSQVCQWDPS